MFLGRCEPSWANWVWADKTPGVVYGRTDRGLYRSDDNCLTWTFIEDVYLAGYSTGNTEGEIYTDLQ